MNAAEAAIAGLFGSKKSGGDAFTFSADGKFQYPENVTVPKTVTSIVDSQLSFKYHSEIKSIDFESRDADITFAANAFGNCTGLEEFSFPNRTIHPSSGMFSSCSSLARLNFPTGAALSIDRYSGSAFAYTPLPQSEFEKILNHNVSTNLASAMFRGCSGITSVAYPDSITDESGSMNTFRECSNLVSIDFNNVTAIGNSTFSESTSLRTVIFRKVVTCPNWAASNANNPFYGCTAIEDIQLPSGWTESFLVFTNSLTHDSMVAMFTNLYDYTGGTAHGLTLGATNLARLSEAEKAVATAKNWVLA